LFKLEESKSLLSIVVVAVAFYLVLRVATGDVKALLALGGLDLVEATGYSPEAFLCA
jgi:hypothetical protein